MSHTEDHEKDSKQHFDKLTARITYAIEQIDIVRYTVLKLEDLQGKVENIESKV